MARGQGSRSSGTAGPPTIEPRDLLPWRATDELPLILDVRSRSSDEKDPAGIPGDLRVPPDPAGTSPPA